MRGRLRSASRSDTRPPQRWQRPTKTRDPNWHRAGSGSTRVRMEAGREATTTCWAWQAEPEGNTRIPIRCRGGQLADGRLRKERSKSQNLSKKGKTTKTRAAWASRWSATRRQEKPAKTGVFSLTRAGLLMEDAENGASAEWNQAGIGGQPWRARTERRTETRSSSKDYADAQEEAVNKRARKSMEGKDLAPQVGLGSEDHIDNIGSYWFYCNTSNVFGQKCPLCTTDLSHATLSKGRAEARSKSEILRARGASEAMTEEMAKVLLLACCSRRAHEAAGLLIRRDNCASVIDILGTPRQQDIASDRKLHEIVNRGRREALHHRGYAVTTQRTADAAAGTRADIRVRYGEMMLKGYIPEDLLVPTLRSHPFRPSPPHTYSCCRYFS